MGGGIARWMGELTKCYAPGSLIVSTGQYSGSATTDDRFPNRIDRIPIPARRLRTAQGLVRWARRAQDIARSEQIEFSWCGNLKPAAYPARWVASRARVPYGVLVHGGDLLTLQQQIGRSSIKRFASRALLSSASVLVANSRWTADLCRSVLDALELESARTKVRVVPLGSDPAQFRPGIDPVIVRERYGLNGRRWLITVARLTRHKGIDTGLDALARLGDSHPDVGYAVVGSGRDLPALENQARRLGLSDRVRFLSDVPDRDLPGLYNCAEIYLGLSRQIGENVEGFGISLVEASACGLPVIAGRSGGMPDAVREDESGILVDSENLEEVSTVLRRLLDDRILARRLGAGGRRAVETYYNWQRVATELSDIGHQLGKATRLEVAR
jgi:phosphatidylinositol alpha-1,6-mannosyltransferase